MSDDQYDEAFEAIAKHVIADAAERGMERFALIPPLVRPGIEQRIFELVGDWELDFEDYLAALEILQDRVKDGTITERSYKL